MLIKKFLGLYIIQLFTIHSFAFEFWKFDFWYVLVMVIPNLQILKISLYSYSPNFLVAD